MKKGLRMIGLAALSALLVGCGSSSSSATSAGTGSTANTISSAEVAPDPIVCTTEEDGMTMTVTATAEKAGDKVSKIVMKAEYDLNPIFEEQGVDIESVDMDTVVESITPAMINELTEEYGIPEEDITVEVTDGVMYFEAAINDVEEFAKSINGIVPKLDLEDMQEEFEGYTCK